MKSIKFGTDGWRAIIARDFTFAACRAVAQGIAGYMNSQNLTKKGIVIGYDNRFLSQEFARECCKVLAGNGIKVFLIRKTTPTPVTAYAVRLKEAGGALMITASHNPPEYNGIKFIPYYAGPALPEITGSIEAEINRVLEGGKIYELNLAEALQLDLFQEIDIDREYINHLMKLIKPEYFEGSSLKVVIDPLYGAGIGYVDKVLGQIGCEVRTIHNYRDVLFGGSMPEPVSPVLAELKRAVVSYNTDAGLAMDGDADRFGLIDHEGRYVSGNQFLPLLLNHLLKTRSARGPVCRTVATTHMLDRVARANGLQVVEVPVGFKYIGEALREKGCLMGGEESGGLSILGHIPEKDGIMACLLAAEMLAYSGKNFHQLLEELHNEYGSLFSERIDIQVEEHVLPLLQDKLSSYRPKTIAGIKVVSNVTIDGQKIMLEDGSWVLLRSSGTEPVIRIYIESDEAEKLESLKQEVVKVVEI